MCLNLSNKLSRRFFFTSFKPLESKRVNTILIKRKWDVPINATQPNQHHFSISPNPIFNSSTIHKCILIAQNEEKKKPKIWCMDLMPNFVFAIQCCIHWLLVMKIALNTLCAYWKIVTIQTIQAANKWLYLYVSNWLLYLVDVAFKIPGVDEQKKKSEKYTFTIMNKEWRRSCPASLETLYLTRPNTKPYCTTLRTEASKCWWFFHFGPFS